MFMHLRFSFTLTIGAAAICSTTAYAVDHTRYVSITGSNANACTLAAPCRTLQKAIGVTPAGGEIQILDSGSYGFNATIKKSLTISGNGHTVYLGNPITIDQAGVVVALRGLVLDGQGAVADGVSIVAADTVHIERCVIRSFAGKGISSESSASGVKLFVTGTTSRDNGVQGLRALNAQLMVDNSHFENNDIGLQIALGNAAITRSTASGNRFDGIFASDVAVNIVSTTAANNARFGFFTQIGSMMLKSATAHGNVDAGLKVVSSVARISDSVFTRNGTGIDSNGTVRTLGNNLVDGNTNDAVGGIVQAITPF